MTKTKALIYYRLYDSVAEWIKYRAFNMLTYHEKTSKPVRILH